MRVIAGSARRTNLKTVAGKDTRPTTDRIKETLFNILQPDLADARFLDLFSGSGAIGIEALSRGAQTAVFVEKRRAAVLCIEENLKATHLESCAELLQMDALLAIKRLDGREAFHIIYMDPPYQEQWEDSTLRALAGTSLVDANTIVIVEASLWQDFSFVQQLGYQVVRQKQYKTNQHVFLALQEDRV